MNAIEHAVALPPDEVVVHRATRRKILRNIAPLTTGAQDVHQAVHHRTHVGAALAAARPRRRNERRNNRPLLVHEVAWVPQMITIVSRSVFLRPHRQPPANQTASFESQMIPVTPEVLRRTLTMPMAQKVFAPPAAPLHVTQAQPAQHYVIIELPVGWGGTEPTPNSGSAHDVLLGWQHSCNGKLRGVAVNRCG
jgi:hypothetical protein